MSKKLTEEEKNHIANSKETYEVICNKFTIDKSVVSRIKKAAGTSLGRGKNTFRESKLTIEQQKYIIGSKETAVVLGERFNVSSRTVNNVRVKAGAQLKQGRKPTVKTTPEQIEIILSSTLSSRKLEEQTGLSYNVIIKVRRKNGLNDKTRSHGRKKIVFTEEELVLVRNMSLSAYDVQIKTGIGYGVINRKRQELGLSTRMFNKLNPKPKKERVCTYIPRPKKEKVIETKSIKKVNVPVRKSQFEIENDRIRKAIKAKEAYKEVERKKIEDGYRYVTRLGRFGIKETVLVKQ